MYIMDAGRSLTPEEIENIKHTITPIERVSGIITGTQIFIDAERDGSGKCRRLETVDKLR